MSSSFLGLEIAKSAMQAQQAAMDVSGHNIANSNTVGYSRQTPHFSQRTTPLGGLFVPPQLRNLGNGVEVDNVQRIRDKFIDIQIRQESRTGAYWNTINQGYEQIELILGEPGDSGLSQAFDQFWNSWQELAKTPETQASRALLAETADLLAQAFNQTHQQLTREQEQLNEKVAIKVGEVNERLKQIYDLNRQIARLGASGGNISDYQDRLDLLVDEVSQVLKFQVEENQNGTYTLFLQGRVMVDQQGFNLLEVNTDVGSDFYRVYFASNGQELDMSYQEGELRALFDFRDSVLPEYQTHLDSLAQGIIGGVNAVHSQGYTLEEPPVLGGVFFDGTGAADMAVNSAILSDYQKIAASSAGAPGDGEIALEIARLRDTALVGGIATPDDYYRGVIAQLGASRDEAQRIYSNQQLLLEQLDVRKESVSGVSLDEEMTNLIKFQHAFNAAASLTRVIDEMLDTIVNQLK